MSWFPATPPKQRWAFALTAIVSAIVLPVHAQTSFKRAPLVEDKNAPTVIEAEEITGRPEREVTLTRDVDVVRDKTRMTADTACFKQIEDELEASGHIHMWRFADQYTGDYLKLNLDSGQGYMLQPTYKLMPSNGQGAARRIDFINQDESVVTDGTYSTCNGPNPDWYLKSSRLNLDKGRDVGKAENALVYFKNVPFIGSPAMSFSLSGARRSGWLPPTPGFNSKNGAELMVPYYFNIAPNRDLTLYPNYIATRGLQLGAQGRYIGENAAGTYAGNTYAEFLLNDKQTRTDRYMINSVHTQALAPGLSYGWTLRADSDNLYPTDFSKSVAISSERQLLRELRTDYRGQFWSLTARVQNYQVLQDPASVLNPALIVPRPYDRLPDIVFHMGRFDMDGIDWAFDSELTRFWHPTMVRGNRLVAVPQISYPFIGPSYFVTPKLMMNLSAYQLDQNALTSAQFPAGSPARAIPTFSLDSGLVFERDGKLFGRAITQTLEPRLFYVYTPYHDQSGIPVFDTAAATFNLAQLFSENRFVGADRIGDANQVTAALTSRYLESNGTERLRLTFGQRFYFRDQRVQLDASIPTVNVHSDILLAAGGRIADSWGFDSGMEYDPGGNGTVSSNYSLQWQPAPKKVLNLGYRYVRGSFKNADLSTQWPLSANWYGVARMSYSILSKAMLESLGGLEYNGGCWVFRTGAQRFVTASNTLATSIFFQLELNGLSQFGVGNPLDVLKKSIPGYQKLNPAVL